MSGKLEGFKIVSAVMENPQLLDGNKASFEQHFTIQFPPDYDLTQGALEDMVAAGSGVFAGELTGKNPADLVNILERLKYAEAIVELGHAQNAAALEAERLENRRIAMEDRRQRLYHLWTLNRYPFGNQPVYETPHIGAEVDLSAVADEVIHQSYVPKTNS